MPTAAYLAMATKGGLFLENTARDAFAKTGNPRVKKFARAEVTEQVALANRIDAATGGSVPVRWPAARRAGRGRRRPRGGTVRHRGRSGRAPPAWSAASSAAPAAGVPRAG